jgi:hypothetical protein
MTPPDLSKIVNLRDYPIQDDAFRVDSLSTLAQQGALVMPNFIQAAAIAQIKLEGESNIHKAYFKTEQHNIYLTGEDASYPSDHSRNRLVTSSKGCITDDCVPKESPLRTLYDSEEFKSFLCAILGEQQLHPYADPLSSINLHYAKTGQELGWHFDNSSFAITLMIQEPVKGGQFEYVSNVRDADKNEMGFDTVKAVLDEHLDFKTISMQPGTLVLFRGRNALHRVASNEGDVTRMLAGLAYNSKPDIELSESARMTFYGRLN